MKVLTNKIADSYHEIEVEKSFLWFKWSVVYRKSNGSIMRFKAPDKYYNIGLSEYCDIIGLFRQLNPPK